MSDDVYRKLAQRLDAIPNGFPATESGVELRLLAKVFEPEEAALASVMKLTYESAAEIGARAGLEAETAERMLKGMARKGQIRVRRKEKQLVFELMPFAVGFYEEQLPRIDAELAELFEEYIQETKGALVTHSTPSIHRVVPVAEAIRFDLKVYPYEQAVGMVKNAKSWGVRDCICRIQQKLVGKGCDHKVDNCLAFAPIEGVFDHGHVSRAISKEEALNILQEAAEAGLVHCPGNYRDDVYYICNCCTCCCGILRGVAEFGAPTAIARSDFRAVVDEEECIGCEECVERCQFDALSVPEDVCQVEYARCVGCGVCVITCPSDALHLERRPEGEVPPPPADQRDWMEQRAKARGIRMEEIL
jgi:Pyruvate/2-oxoacid:ferredoxin oxidoreductase delta subunit